MATAMDTTARGKRRPPLLPNPAMATMVDTEDMATTATTARGRLKPLLWLRLSPRLLPSLATDTMARGLLMPMLDTTAMEDMATDMATEDTGTDMVMDMAMDMDTMDKKEGW